MLVELLAPRWLLPQDLKLDNTVINCDFEFSVSSANNSIHTFSVKNLLVELKTGVGQIQMENDVHGIDRRMKYKYTPQSFSLGQQGQFVHILCHDLESQPIEIWDKESPIGKILNDKTVSIKENGLEDRLLQRLSRICRILQKNSESQLVGLSEVFQLKTSSS